MKHDIATLYDFTKHSVTSYKDSRVEAREVIDMFHDRQYTQAQIKELQGRGQPVESFNIIKLFTNAIQGFFETVANDIQVKPRYPSIAARALVMDDAVSYVLDESNYETEKMYLQQDLIQIGYCVYKSKVEDTGRIDDYGRPVYKLTVRHVPGLECYLDPVSVSDDYSEDARGISRVRWVSRDYVKAKWPRKYKELTPYQNWIDDDEVDLSRISPTQDRSNAEINEVYQIIHTISSDKGVVTETIWSGDVQLEQIKVTSRKAKWSYGVVKLYRFDKVEHYGLFREVIESQKAINQAILQIQLLVNTKAAIVEDTAVDDFNKFKKAFSRINRVLKVTRLEGIKIEDMSADILQQYGIIDKGMDRIKQVLGINDSFLGQAFASDSGRKVQLQKQSSFAQLTPLVRRVELMQKSVGMDVITLIKQYMTANQILNIVDPVNGLRSIEVNRPLLMNGQPIYDEMIDPKTGKPMEDEDGNILIAPINDIDTELESAEVFMIIDSVNYNNHAERNQLLFETTLQGPVGMALMQAAPAEFFSMVALSISEYGTKHSAQMSEIIRSVANKLSNGEIDPKLFYNGEEAKKMLGSIMGGSTGNTENGPSSKTLQVPEQGGRL